MKSIKIFEVYYDESKLQKNVNKWIKEMSDQYVIEEIQYRMSDKYHSCMIIYSESIKI